MKSIIFIFIISYCILIIFNLDEIDRKSLYYQIKHMRSESKYIDFSVKRSYDLYSDKVMKSNVLKILRFLYSYLILLPFDKLQYSRVTVGGGYSSYIHEIYAHTEYPLCVMNDKIFWYKIFLKYNINHPELICYKKNSKIYNVNDYNPNQVYLYKPINGSMGYGIDTVKGRQINELINKTNVDNILIQEKLYDCLYKKARHFRFVSLYNGDNYLLWEIKSNNKEDITSNISNNGYITLCEELKCDSLNFEQQQKLDSIMNLLSKMHKMEFPKVLSISWDLMIDCDGTIINIYCLEGNIFALIWPSPSFWPDKDWLGTSHAYDYIIEDFKVIATEFYNDNNL